MARPLKRKGFGQLGSLPTLVLLFGIGIIVTSIMAQITGTIRSNQCTTDGDYWNATSGSCTRTLADTNLSGSLATNISASGLDGFKEIGDWFTTIGLILGAIVVLSALFMLMRR